MTALLSAKNPNQRDAIGRGPIEPEVSDEAM
jgi:hypothetical protein